MRNYKTNIRQVLLGLLVVLGSTKLQAQTEDIEVNRVRRTLSAAGNVTPVPTGMRTLPLPASELEGSYYLQDEYVPTRFVLSADETISNVPAKYNVRTNVFIINSDNGFGALRGTLVKEFSFYDGSKERKFLNSSILPFNPFVSGSGFYDILFEGNDIMLLGKPGYDIIPSNYNIALDVGERKSFIKLKTEYYILEKSNYKQIKKFNNKNLAIFGNKKSAVKKFIEAEDLNYKVEPDLIKVVEYYQSLISI